MITAAERGEIDAAISEAETMRVKLVKANLQSLFHQLDHPIFPIDVYALVRNDNPELASLVLQGFEKIPLQELRTLESIWLSHHAKAHFSSAKRHLPLTEAQQVWLKDNRQLTVGISKDWAPLEFLDNEGQPAGINKEVIEAIVEGIGFELNFQAFDSWTELRESFQRKEVDLVLGLSNDDSPHPLFDFSDVYWQMPWSIIHRQSFGRATSITNFEGKQLAMVNGYGLIRWIQEQYPNIDIVPVNTTHEGLLAVQQGFVEGFIDGLPVTSKFAEQESIVPLEVAVVPELPTQDSRIGMQKDNDMLKTILNQRLGVIDEQKRREIFSHWFDINIHTGWDKRLVTRIATQAGFATLVIILFVLLWNRRLHLEVARRKALESKMKHMATHDELTGLANRTLMKTQITSAIALHQRQQMKLAVLFVDLDGFKKVNDKFGHDFGDQVLKQVANRLASCVRKSDSICRFGGDEFVILLTSLNNKEEAAFIAEKIIDVISQPYMSDQHQAYLGSSIGISVFPEDGDNEAELLKMADNLMYRVKSTGKNNYIYR